MNAISLFMLFAQTALAFNVNLSSLDNYTAFQENFSSFPYPYPRVKQYPVTGIPGDPVFITPYIEESLIAEGQHATLVKPFIGNVQSHSGFITVNKKFNSNMFFWFFRSEEIDWKSAPVLLWLQGGPGATSLYGLFEENGPYLVDENGLRKRNYTWTKEFNVLYIDNPVGTGFSFTQDDRGYADNQHDIGRDLYEALTQFFRLFPEVSENEFYLTGESYAGKYIPTIAHVIHKRNPSAAVKINLRGLAIGNGLTDPINMMIYSDYLYQLGLVDSKTAKKIGNFEELIRVSIRSGKMLDAWYYRGLIMSIVRQVGFPFPYDYRDSEATLDKQDAVMYEFLQRDYVRKAIHVGSFIFNDEFKVYFRLRHDILLSVAHHLPELLDNYKILFYNGQCDIADAYPLTVNFLRNLSWKGALQYADAERKPWYVESHLAGYWKSAYNLTEVMVRNSGHMVPTNQPKWAYSMLKRFIQN